MEWLIEAREKLGLNQKRAAEAIGITQAFLSQIENGVRTPSIKIAKRIGEVLQTDWTRFYTKE